MCLLQYKFVCDHAVATTSGFIGQCGYIQRRMTTENTIQVVQIEMVRPSWLQVAVCETKWSKSESRQPVGCHT